MVAKITTKTQILFLFFILLSTVLFSAYLFLPTSNFQSLDNGLRDLYFKFRGPVKTSKNIIIVDIDEKSLKGLGQWPWERDKFAQILTNLTENGVGIIGIDMVFPEMDKTSPKAFAKKWNFDSSNMPDYDLILSKTVAETPTILSYVFDFQNHTTKDAPYTPTMFIENNKEYGEFVPKAKGVLTNLDIIQNASHSSGFMNNIPDEAGIVRSVPLIISYKNMLYSSLAFEMYRIILNTDDIVVSYSSSGIDSISLKNHLVYSDRFAKLHVNFKGPAKSYKYISAVDIFNNSINKKELEGKIVLIGTSAAGLMDLRSTPMESVIPGVEIHANIIDNLLNNDMLAKPSWDEFVDLSMILFTLFIILFIFSRLSILKLMISYTVLFSSIVYLNYYLLFTQHLILNSIFPLIAMILSLITILGINYLFETRQKEIIKNSFSKKVSQQVMNDLLTNLDNTDLSAKELEVTIYFSDIRDFTSISEQLKSPKRITSFLNFYMNAMVKSIEKNHGTIDKFIGDAVMAYWNAPLKINNHADKAVLTALEQIKIRDTLNLTIKSDFGFDVDYGIGINTGQVIVGEIGSSGRSDYTIIGDAVNLASRVEGLCKPYKVRLIITEFTKTQLTKQYVIQLLDIVRVKGKHEPVKIYEVLTTGDASQEKSLELNDYTHAHNLYVEANFIDAKELFVQLYDKYQKYLYKLYTERCEKLIHQEIKDFDGVFEFTTK